jgi:hypothetical protein
MRSRLVADLKTLEALGPWLQSELAAQELARLKEVAEEKRRAALPVPDVDTIIMYLTKGGRVTTGGGRYSETFFWQDGRLQCEVRDEGYTNVYDSTKEELAEQIKNSPDPFRKAVGILK